jgi:hypothetical protein
VRIIQATALACIGAATLLVSACAQAVPTTSNSKGTIEAGGQAPVVANTKPADVPVSIVTEISPNGTVVWLDAEFVTTEPGSRRVHATSDKKRTAKFATNAVFLSTEGCDPQKPEPLGVDADGLGTVPCTRMAYAAMTPYWVQYAPSIFFNDQGEVVKMTNHQ